MMKLYFAPGACSQAPHIVLREAGLEFELEQVDLRARRTASGADFLSINPKGYVPALILDDGQLLTEVPSIMQYLADRAPASGLLAPVGDMARYRALEWMGFISTELHKAFSPLFKTDTPEEYKAISRDNLARRLDLVNVHLADRPYLLGERLSVADPYLFAVSRWANFHQIDLARWPNLQAFLARMEQRPAVHAALQAEGLLKAG